jgi:hypothetical protein
MRHVLILCAILFTISEAIAGQVTTFESCPIYAWPAREPIGRIESGVQLDSLSYKKGYVQVSLTAWVSNTDIRGVLRTSAEISAMQNGADLFDKIDGTTIGIVLPFTRLSVDSVAHESVRVRMFGWINRGSLVGGTAVALTAPPARDESRYYDALSTSNTFIAAGFCYLATAVVSFNGASHANLDKKGIDDAIDDYHQLHISVPDWMKERRDDYASVRTRYTIAGIVTTVAGAYCILRGITVRQEARRSKPLASITPSVSPEAQPKICVQLRF